MEENTGFSMKYSLLAPGLGCKYSNSLRTEEDEPIYTYNDKYVRWFARQSIKGGRVCAFNQYDKSKICRDVLKILPRETKIEGNVYDIIEAIIKYKSNHLKIIKEEYESKFVYYSDINEDEMNEYNNKKLGELPIHTFLQQLSLNYLLWDFDAMSLYPSAMSDEKSIYPKIETGYAYTKDMNDELVEKFSNQRFTQGCEISKIKHSNPKYLIVQHLPVREKVKILKLSGCVTVIVLMFQLLLIFEEIVKIGGRVVEIFDGVFLREIFEVSPFEKVIDKRFELRQKYKDESKNVMQLLVKLIMNGLYGEQIRKDTEESYQCKSEQWMLTEYGERVLDHQEINYGNLIVKMKDDDGLQDEVKKVTTMPLHLGASVLSNNKRIMNNLIHAINGFYANDLYYEDTNSMYIQNKP